MVRRIDGSPAAEAVIGNADWFTALAPPSESAARAHFVAVNFSGNAGFTHRQAPRLHRRGMIVCGDGAPEDADMSLSGSLIGFVMLPTMALGWNRVWQ